MVDDEIEARTPGLHRSRSAAERSAVSSSGLIVPDTNPPGDEVDDDRRLQDDMNHWKEFKYDHATQEKEHKKHKRELNEKLEQIKYVLSHRAEQTH